MKLAPKKSLGQNSLIDQNTIKKYEAGNINEKDSVLEIDHKLKIIRNYFIKNTSKISARYRER